MAGPDLPRVLVIVGPTGVGKTDVACRVARELDGEIVSADSRQIYKGMDIGTGKAEPEEPAAAPHHMLDVVEPSETFDAARFGASARGCFSEIASRDMTPMLVGGTGLYVKAALEGLFPGPRGDEGLRRRLREEEARVPGCLHRRLGLVDPAKAGQLNPKDLTRIIRAIEVYELTGVPLSEAQAGWTARPWPHVAFGLTRPREELYARIDARVREMVERGLFEEASRLMHAGFGEGSPGLKTIGYREAVDHLKGRISEDEAISLIQRNTRRYAKRQMTWFSRMAVKSWVVLGDPDEAVVRICAERMPLE